MAFDGFGFGFEWHEKGPSLEFIIHKHIFSYNPSSPILGGFLFIG